VPRLVAALVVFLVGAWALWATGGRTTIVRLVEAPGPVAAVRATADGVVVEMRDGRRAGLTLVGGRPVFGPAGDLPATPPVANGTAADWTDVLALAAQNEGRLDPIAVLDLDGDRVEDWIALETVGEEARLLILHRTRSGPVTIAFLDGVAGRFEDGSLAVAVVDTEGTGRPDLMVATADRRVVMRVRLWPGRLEVEERIALVGQVATAIVPLGPRAIAAGLADGKVATVAWPDR
jgi:hypothetical protein